MAVGISEKDEAGSGAPRGLEAMREELQHYYPSPIAAACRRYFTTPSVDLQTRPRLIVDIFESWIKFLAIAQIQAHRATTPNLVERLPQREKTLEFLKRPPLGGWVGLVRVLSGISPAAGTHPLATRIADWYQMPVDSDAKVVIRGLNSLDGVRLDNRAKVANEIVNGLVTYRNVLYHGATQHRGTIKEHLPILEDALAYLLERSGFLKDVMLFAAEDVSVLPGKRFRVGGKRLQGVMHDTLEEESGHRLEPAELYIGTSEWDGVQRPVGLSPFMIWQVNPDRREPEVFYYNDAKRTSLTYLSYQSGARYSHHELHKEFEQLLDLELEGGGTDPAASRLPPERRAALGEELTKRSHLLRDQGKLEDALKTVELAIEQERTPERLLIMAELEHELGDPPSSVQFTLESCLELDPGNLRALQLVERFKDPQATKWSDVALKVPESREGWANRTMLRRVLPASLRSYAAPLWLAGLTGWYVVSALAELAMAGEPALIVKALQLLITWILVGVTFTVNTMFARTRSALSLQLASMRMGRFDVWFERHQELMFGPNEEREADCRALEHSWNRWWAIGVVALTLSAYLLTDARDGGILLQVVRTLDFALLFFVGFPWLRFAWGLSSTTLDLSRQTLKPTLSRLSDEGIRALAGPMVVTILAGCAGYASYWIMGAMVVRGGGFLDLLFLGMSTVFYLGWSMGLPVALRQAMKASRAAAVVRYTGHLEESFNAFLESPDEESLKRFLWLRGQQQVVRDIGAWPLSWGQTLLVVGLSNLILFSVNVWYVGFRLGHWDLWLGLVPV